jgi:hypothetical protein
MAADKGWAAASAPLLDGRSDNTSALTRRHVSPNLFFISRATPLNPLLGLRRSQSDTQRLSDARTCQSSSLERTGGR